MENFLKIDESIHLINDINQIPETVSKAFVSFIGKVPVTGKFPKAAHVWQTARCSAFYHHNGKSIEVTLENSVELFCKFHGIEVKNGGCELFKSTRMDFKDFYTGNYDYRPGKTVQAVDWIDCPKILCGNALHLAPTLEIAKQWNEDGRIFKCKVKLKDMNVNPYNVSQVRCKSVDVPHESGCHYLHFWEQDCDCIHYLGIQNKNKRHKLKGSGDEAL